MVVWLCCLGLLQHAMAGTCVTVKHLSPRIARERERKRKALWSHYGLQRHVPKGLLTSYWTLTSSGSHQLPIAPQGGQ